MCQRIVECRKNEIKCRRIRVITQKHKGLEVPVSQILSELLYEISMLFRCEHHIDSEVRFVEREEVSLYTIIYLEEFQIACK